MKIAIVVQGRFHAFDLGRALLARGHEVTVFTNYPASVVAGFGFPASRVRNCVWHGILQRVVGRLRRIFGQHFADSALHSSFGHWAARRLAHERWDFIYIWSGVAEETLLHFEGNNETAVWMMRGSAHIRIQAKLLDEEAQRACVPLGQPSPWMLAREEREYALATRISVLSTFAVESFLSCGVPPTKLALTALGADMQAFRATDTAVADRRRRILSGEPLRILYVGAVSFQKGMLDLSATMNTLGVKRFIWRVVGALTPETRFLVPQLRRNAEVTGKRPQDKLFHDYAWADIFVFPTIQDGFAVVLCQAQAAALPILATNHCGAPDIVQEGRTGWIIPIRQPEAISERLRWADSHREELAEMVEYLHCTFMPRTWDNVAADFEDQLAGHAAKGQHWLGSEMP